MKIKFYILLILILGHLSVSSQVRFNDDSIIATFSFSEDALIKINLTNQENVQDTVYWKLEKLYFSNSWQSQLCDLNLCYGFNVDKCSANKGNIFTAGATGLWTLHINPFSVQDSAIMLLKLYDDREFSNVIDSLPIYINIGTVSTNKVLATNEVTIYPNPTTDYFQISNKSKIGKVDIFNLIGKKVKTFEKYQNMYAINDIRDGMYIVRVYDNRGKVMKVSRLKIIQQRP